MVAKIGTINGFVTRTAKLGNKKFSFDGTTRGLTIAARGLGAKEGAIIHANFGLSVSKMRLEATPWDDRAGGFWCSDVK